MQIDNPAQYLRQTAVLLWEHGEGPANKLPRKVCLAAATQFDVAIDEWRYTEEIGIEHLRVHLNLAVALREALDA